MAERKGDQQNVSYQKDLWGHQVVPPGGRRKKKLPGSGKIDGEVVRHGSLFSASDVQPGHVTPLTSVKTPQQNVSQSNMLSQVSEQAITPEPGATIVNAEETAHEEIHAAAAPTITILPVDPEVTIPEDLIALVTHVPRYLMPEEQQNKSVIHLISTRFFILGYDQGQYRHQIAGIILESDDGGERQPLLYHGVPHTIDRALQQIREVAIKQGYLHKDGVLHVDTLVIPDDLRGVVTYVPYSKMTEQEREAFDIPTKYFVAEISIANVVDKTAAPVGVFQPGEVIERTGNSAELKTHIIHPGSRNSEIAFYHIHKLRRERGEDVTIPEDLREHVTFLPLEVMSWNERRAITLSTSFYLCTWKVEGRRVFVPGVVLRTDAETGDPHVYNFFHYATTDVELAFSALREVIPQYKEHWPDAGKVIHPTQRDMGTVQNGAEVDESFQAYDACSYVSGILSRKIMHQMDEARKPKPKITRSKEETKAGEVSPATIAAQTERKHYDTDLFGTPTTASEEGTGVVVPSDGEGKAQIRPLEPMPLETLEDRNAFMAQAVTVITINSEREDIESIHRQRITTPYFIVSVFTPPRGTRHIPGRVILPRFDGVAKCGIYYSIKGEQDGQATENLYAGVQTGSGAARQE